MTSKRLWMLLLLPAGIVQAVIASPVETQHQQTYAIYGDSSNALRKEMNRKGVTVNGQRFDAETRWNVNWRFNNVLDDNGCRITQAQVTLDIRMTLPEWKDRAAAKPKLQQRWDHYYRALVAHEEGHARFGRQAAQGIQALLPTLSAADCHTLNRLANDKAMGVINRYAEQERAYDRDTNHGMNDGAIFP